MKFTIETRRTCSNCRRPVDAVRVHGPGADEYPGLRMSRHFLPNALKFCGRSLDEVR